MRSCRNCYYRGIIGFDSWCCHPAICGRLVDPGRWCIEHVYYDSKMPIDIPKVKYTEIVKKEIRPKEKSYKIVRAGTAIFCKYCGVTSFNPDDVELKFCGRCKIFHEDR